MRVLVMYEYPPQPAGLDTQGDMLYRGLRENGVDCMPAPRGGDLQKQWLYELYQPDVTVGVGWWGFVPQIVQHPKRFGIQAVPWLVADGWVANYQDELNALPLILTTSAWVSENYVRDGVKADSMVVQPIGCYLDTFHPIPRSEAQVSAVRRALGIADDEVFILTIGGDGASKGAQEMMKALAKVDAQFSKWKFICKVWDQERTMVQNRLDMELAEELGIRDKVKYVGGVITREFMPYLYNACDIYAGPSRQEGFGMPHVEAQSCGKPVLSIDAMGIKETVIHGETGFLADVAEWISISEGAVGPNGGFAEPRTIKFDEPKVIGCKADVDQLANYVLRLMTDPGLRDAMGVAGRSHVVQKFDYRDVAARVMSLIKERGVVPTAV